MLTFLKWCGFCIIIVFLKLICCVSEVNGALVTLRGPRCGTLVCASDEYCNQYSHSCDSCKSICEPEDHNFDEAKCKSQCEGNYLKLNYLYIYDQRYLQKSDSGGDDGSLRAAIQKLQVNYVVILTLLIIVIIALIVVVSVFVWRWKTNNNVTWATFHKNISRKKSENNTNGVSANKTTTNDQTGKKPDLRLEITASSVQSEPTPVTMTTGITPRIPAEDSIEYAYDNPAMSNSPKSKMRAKRF
ncbi:hypothetical protein MML48_3g00012077 [Holotrichia oblita]|uniref:Uncharacterized protein n=1 Tax=Holotrichia oblita TaxID=644536 RepID=A0ACB9TD64_HOLOL|nr:hypothetical protein MML48_3g00012077 [Holotrichia oblita]